MNKVAPEPFHFDTARQTPNGLEGVNDEGSMHRDASKMPKKVMWSEVNEEQQIVHGGKKVVTLKQTTTLGASQTRRGANAFFGAGENSTPLLHALHAVYECPVRMGCCHIVGSPT